MPSRAGFLNRWLNSCRYWYRGWRMMRRLRSDYLRINGFPGREQDLWDKEEELLLLQVMRETGER